MPSDKSRPLDARVPAMDPGAGMLKDDDILPICEYNLTDQQRSLRSLGRKVWSTRTCGVKAEWMVFFETDICSNSFNNPHDHIVMTCEEHRNYFDHVRTVHITCPGLPGPTKTYIVTSIEKL